MVRLQIKITSQNIILLRTLLLRPVGGIRGFSRETVVEVTTNVETQELCHRENGAIGYEEHPRLQKLTIWNRTSVCAIVTLGKFLH